MPIFGRQPGGSRPRIPPRLIIGVIIAAVAVIGYFGRSTLNPLTGKTQRIALTQEQEIALGLQAAPEMARQLGGLSTVEADRRLVKSVGDRIVAALPEAALDYPYDFHVLADQRTVNAFALPGGQIFITAALLSRLESEGQLAGVLAHEVGHVVGRHSAAQMAKSELLQGLIGATTVAASDSYDSARAAQAIASTVGNLIQLKYGRTDELESDRLGLAFMAAAGYDPRSMIRVMEILRAASGGGGQPEFASTHPDPGNRIESINEVLREMFPSGVPDGLTK